MGQLFTIRGKAPDQQSEFLSDAFAFDRPEGYYDLFTLIAHEFFHAWNVKRLRAEELGPFDYERENATNLLWFHEGFTSFMQFSLVLQAGLVPWAWVSRKLASIWTDYTTRAGRHEQPPRAAALFRLRSRRLPRSGNRRDGGSGLGAHGRRPDRCKVDSIRRSF